MKKVLLIDTNVASFPIYQYLIDNEYDVYVMSGKPQDCLSKYTSNYIQCDYSNIELLKTKIDEYQFDFIIPGCNDGSYLSAAKININNKYFGIDSVHTTEIINNKNKFRKFAIENKLNVPQLFTIDNVKNINFPIIVKPVDAYSGRGVTVIKNVNESAVNSAIETAINFSNSKSYLIEEYIEGQLYSHSAFIQNKKIIQDFIVIEDCTANPFTVDTSYVVHNFPKNILNQLRNDIETMSRVLKLEDGLIHTQFIKTKNLFKIIEVTRRCPGDLYNLLIQKSTGVNYMEFYIKPFLNQTIKNKNKKLRTNHILRHILSIDKDSSFVGIKYKEKINIDLFVPLMTTGDELKKSPFGRIGISFLKFKNKIELKNIYKKILNRKLYSI